MSRCEQWSAFVFGRVWATSFREVDDGGHRWNLCASQSEARRIGGLTMYDDGYCLGCGADFMHGEPHFGDCAPQPGGQE